MFALFGQIKDLILLIFCLQYNKNLNKLGLCFKPLSYQCGCRSEGTVQEIISLLIYDTHKLSVSRIMVTKLRYKNWVSIKQGSLCLCDFLLYTSPSFAVISDGNGETFLNPKELFVFSVSNYFAQIHGIDEVLSCPNRTVQKNFSQTNTLLSN